MDGRRRGCCGWEGSGPLPWSYLAGEALPTENACCSGCIWNIPFTSGPASVGCTKVMRLWGPKGEGWRDSELKLEKGQPAANLFNQGRKACLTRRIRLPLSHPRERLGAPGVEAVEIGFISV